MPTSGRFVGAVLYAALAWYVSMMIEPLFPEGKDLGWFREINTFFGFYAGWTIAGSRAGMGYVAAFSYGLTATIGLVVMALFINSSIVMIGKSLEKQYRGAGEAVTDVFQLFVEHGALMSTPEIWVTLLAGGLGAAMIVEFVGQRYT